MGLVTPRDASILSFLKEAKKRGPISKKMRAQISPLVSSITASLSNSRKVALSNDINPVKKVKAQSRRNISGLPARKQR